MNAADSEAALAGRARHMAALFAVGCATEEQLRGLIDAMMYQNIWHDDFLYVLDPKSPCVADMRPAVEAAVRHFGDHLPDKDKAERILIEHQLRPIASGAIDPIEGLNKFMGEFYWDWGLRGNAGNLGEEFGVRDIVVDHFQLDDWLGFMPGFLDNPAQAKEVAGLKANIVLHANAWIEQFGNLDERNLQVLP